jgi:cell fate regulator YaaT (PSP1 superfamily)
MTNTPETKTSSKQAKNKKYMLVRYGLMNLLGLFEHNESKIPKANIRVVIKTDRGLELGTIVGHLSCYKAGQFRWRDDQIVDYFGNNQTEVNFDNIGKFIRFATEADISEQRHLRKIAREETEYCKHFVKQMGLSMKIIDAEHVFGGERIIFYFMSNNRVDFRELVKVMAQEYQTRIEMRQVGSRDEAKLLGDIESCGQQCCCQRFLKLLKPVNMRMAKMQKATLDPAKISGYCGRLKCCLRYEDETYNELKKRLPRRNSVVKTEKGQGRVIDTQILTQLVVVEYENGDREAIGLENIQVVSQSGAVPEKDDFKEDIKSEIVEHHDIEKDNDSDNGDEEVDTSDSDIQG